MKAERYSGTIVSISTEHHELLALFHNIITHEDTMTTLSWPLANDIRRRVIIGPATECHVRAAVRYLLERLGLKTYSEPRRPAPPANPPDLMTVVLPAYDLDRLRALPGEWRSNLEKAVIDFGRENHGRDIGTLEGGADGQPITETTFNPSDEARRLLPGYGASVISDNQRRQREMFV